MAVFRSKKFTNNFFLLLSVLRKTNEKKNTNRVINVTLISIFFLLIAEILNEIHFLA